MCNVEIIQNVRNISYKQNDIYIHKYICMLLNIVNTFCRLTQYLITYNFEKVSQGILFSWNYFTEFILCCIANERRTFCWLILLFSLNWKYLVASVKRKIAWSQFWTMSQCGCTSLFFSLSLSLGRWCYSWTLEMISLSESPSEVVVSSLKKIKSINDCGSPISTNWDRGVSSYSSTFSL